MRTAPWFDQYIWPAGTSEDDSRAAAEEGVVGGIPYGCHRRPALRSRSRSSSEAGDITRPACRNAVR